MTELENKIADRIIEKMDLDKLIEKIGLDVLTDRIAEKAAEMIIKREYPSAPDTPPAPITIPPGFPWTAAPKIEPPVTVMYGVTTTDFHPGAAEQAVHDSCVASASTYKKDSI